MIYSLIIANEKIWLKDVSKLNKKDLVAIFERIEKLAEDPMPEDLQVKRLKNYPVADFRLRVGNYRILLDRDTEKGEVILYRILHRSKLY